MPSPDRLVVSVNVDGLVLLESTTGRIFKANQSGRFVWERLEAGYTCSTCARALADRLGIPFETACHDVERFVASVTLWGLERPWTTVRRDA